MLDKFLIYGKVNVLALFRAFGLFNLLKAFASNKVFLAFTLYLKEILMATKKKMLTAMQIVKKYRIPYSTFTLYANLNFFGAGTRSGNKRLYNAAMIGARMKKIIRYKKAGYPLRMIRQSIRG